MVLRREDLRNRMIRLIGHGRLTVTTMAIGVKVLNPHSYVVEEGGALRRQSLSYAEELRPLAA